MGNARFSVGPIRNNFLINIFVLVEGKRMIRCRLAPVCNVCGGGIWVGLVICTTQLNVRCSTSLFFVVSPAGLSRYHSFPCCFSNTPISSCTWTTISLSI
ncbi:unnamed protein product [Pylaiella littoralis]